MMTVYVEGAAFEMDVPHDLQHVVEELHNLEKAKKIQNFNVHKPRISNTSFNYIIKQVFLLRGFVKLKKIQKSEKNSEVGGCIKPQLGLLFFWRCVFCDFFFLLLYMFPKKIKNWIGGWVFGVWPIRVFLGFFLT